MSKKVIIIGGGIGGLAAANLLQKAGYNVRVYEKNAMLGGRTGVLKKQGFTFDTGPSWYLMPEVFEQYFSLFHVNAKKALALKKLTPGYKVFYETREPVLVTGSLTKDSATFERIEAGSGARLKAYVGKSQEIYRLALRHFLYTNFTNPFQLLHPEIIRHSLKLLPQLVLPIHSKVRRAVKTLELQQLLEYHMVFLGSSPFQAPALYSLMSTLDFQQGVFYPERGMYSLIDLTIEIGTSLGVQYHTQQPVKRILYKGRQATGVLLDSGETISADIVISNADLYHTETKLLAPAARSYPSAYWKKKQSGLSALLLYVGIKGELPQLEHHNLYFVKEWEENFAAIYTKKHIPKKASIYVSRTTKYDHSTAPKGHENLFVLVPIPTEVPLSKARQQQLAQHYLKEFGAVIGVPHLNERVVLLETFGPNEFKQSYNAWQGTALGPSHILKQSAFWRTKNKSKKLRNLYYVGGSTLPGIGLPMCIISAELVYKRIVGDTSARPVRSIKREER